MTTWKRKYLKKKKTKGGFYWKKEKKNREEILHEPPPEIDFTLKKSSTCIQMVFRVTIFHSY